MKLHRPTIGLLMFCLGFALCAAPASAGLGDMLKKAKAKIEAKPKPAAAATKGGIQSRIQPPVTEESLAKFKAALELELAERARTVQFLKSVKSQKAYESCKLEAIQSPEGQKLSEKMMNIKEGATQAEIQQVYTDIGTAMEKLLETKCGPDPVHYGEGYRSDQMRAALGKASDAFAEDDYAYFIWKEWVLEFCDYIEKLMKEPGALDKIAKIKQEGLRIPGTGEGIYYVYTAEEATLLLERCDELVPLIKATM